MDIWSAYNTPLSLGNELRYQIDKANSPFAHDSGYDYDLRGYWLQNGNLNPEDARGHIGDMYKKPNHPTFSIYSKYYTEQPYAVNWKRDYGKILQLLGY